MNSLKKMAIGFGLVSVITLQGLQASKLKECQSKADKISGCAELEYYANSDIKKETPYKNGKEHGSIKGYYENGKLEFEIPTKNGEPNGIAKLYYENGILWFEIPFNGLSKDITIDDIVSLCNNGKELEEDLLNDTDPQYLNKSSGIFKWYYENGNLGFESPLENGKSNGIVKLYYENGNLQGEGSVKNDKLHGILKRYYENGNLGYEGNYVEDKAHGDCKFYSEDGKLLGTARYNHGEAQFVKCATRNLSKEDAKYLLGDITIESFETYCK